VIFSYHITLSVPQQVYFSIFFRVCVVCVCVDVVIGVGSAKGPCVDVDVGVGVGVLARVDVFDGAERFVRVHYIFLS